MSCGVTPEFSKEVCRHALRRGTWTKLLSPGAARVRLHGLLDPSDELQVKRLMLPCSPTLDCACDPRTLWFGLEKGLQKKAPHQHR